MEWKGLQLIGGTGQYLSTIVRTMHLPSSPDPERWPIAEFTDVLLEDCGGRVPRLASSHPIVTPNMLVETTMRRRAMVEPMLPIMQFARGHIDPDVFSGVDYVVTDSLLMNVTAQLDGFAAAGIPTEVLAERVVTPESTVRLLALRHEPREARIIGPEVLREHSVTPTRARFADGLRLAGAELVPHRRRGAGPALNVFLSAPEPIPEPTVVILELRARGRTTWSGTRLVPPLPGGDPRLVAVSFDDIVGAADAGYWVGLGSPETAAEAHRTHQPVLASEREVSDDLVRVAP